MALQTEKFRSQPTIKTNESTKYLFILLRLLGILMPVRYKVLYVIYAIMMNLLSVIILPLTFTLSYLIGVEKMPLNQLFTSLQIGMNVYACVLKFIIIVFKKRNLFGIQALLDKLDDQVIHPEEVSEIQKVIKFGHRMVIFFCIAYFSYSTTTFLGALCSGHPPYSLYNPFLDWRMSNWNFVIASFIEFMMINVVCLQDVANDTFAVIYIRILHTQIKILIMRIARIGSNPNTTQDTNLRELLCCIQNHKKIIKLSKAIAAVISLTVFVQFAISGMALGIAFINISAFGDQSAIIGSCFFIGGMVWELMPMCYFVNSLVDEAERLSNSIFHLNWMDQNKDFQRNCIFFIHRSQKSMVFYAGKVFPITLSSFLAIIRFSFSFCTLLSKMDFTARFN